MWNMIDGLHVGYNIVVWAAQSGSVRHKKSNKNWKVFCSSSQIYIKVLSYTSP